MYLKSDMLFYIFHIVSDSHYDNASPRTGAGSRSASLRTRTGMVWWVLLLKPGAVRGQVWWVLPLESGVVQGAVRMALLLEPWREHVRRVFLFEPGWFEERTMGEYVARPRVDVAHMGWVKNDLHRQKDDGSDATVIVAAIVGRESTRGRWRGLSERWKENRFWMWPLAGTYLRGCGADRGSGSEKRRSESGSEKGRERNEGTEQHRGRRKSGEGKRVV